MAGQGNIRELNALCFVVRHGTDELELIPVNDVGNNELEAFFTDSGAHVVVAMDQADAGRDGYKEVARQPYKTLNFAVST